MTTKTEESNKGLVPIAFELEKGLNACTGTRPIGRRLAQIKCDLKNSMVRALARPAESAS